MIEENKKSSFDMRSKRNVTVIVAIAALAVTAVIVSASYYSMLVALDGSQHPESNHKPLETTKQLVQNLNNNQLNIRTPPPTPLPVFYGNTVSDVATASQLTGIQVKAPSYLPTGIELKMVKIKVQSDVNLKQVALIYAPTSTTVTDDWTFEQVMDSKGIIVIYTQESPSFDKAKWVKDYATSVPGAESKTVHGASAIGINGDPQAGIRSQVIFYDGNVLVLLVSVHYQEAELLKISESTPLVQQ